MRATPPVLPITAAIMTDPGVDDDSVEARVVAVGPTFGPMLIDEGSDFPLSWLVNL